MLRDADDKVRAAAVKWLGRSKSRQAVPFIIPLLEDTNESVRFSAIRALGDIGGRQALEALRVLLESWQKEVRAIALSAVAEIGKRSEDKELVQEAIDLLWWHLVDEKKCAANAYSALQECVERKEELGSLFVTM